MYILSRLMMYFPTSMELKFLKNTEDTQVKAQIDTENNLLKSIKINALFFSFWQNTIFTLASNICFLLI